MSHYKGAISTLMRIKKYGTNYFLTGIACFLILAMVASSVPYVYVNGDGEKIFSFFGNNIEEEQEGSEKEGKESKKDKDEKLKTQLSFNHNQLLYIVQNNYTSKRSISIFHPEIICPPPEV